MEQMSRQEMFNKVLEHSRNMKERCVKENEHNTPQCRYRGNGGNKCFVGALLPDELYKEEFEGKGISELIDDNQEVANFFGSHNGAFLTRLQIIHDDYFSDRESKLKDAASMYGLNYSQIK